jgi:hypothetical protein
MDARLTSQSEEVAYVPGTVQTVYAQATIPEGEN